MESEQLIAGIAMLAMALVRLVMSSRFERQDVEWLDDRFGQDDENRSLAKSHTRLVVGMFTVVGCWLLAA